VGASCDVVVVGAGLAGLAAANHLSGAGLVVEVLEASDGVGGRARTDRHPDGFLLDRGFQLVNPAYPELARVADLDALDLRPFEPGAAVFSEGRVRWLGNPLRRPKDLFGLLSAPVAPLSDKLALGALLARCALTPVRRLERAPDDSAAHDLAAAGLSEAMVDRVLRPFLSGVFLEGDLATSARFTHLVLRSFARGVPSLPAEGVGALARQLASALPPGTVHLERSVEAVEPRVAVAAGQRRPARAVVVATGPRRSASLLGLTPVPTHGVTTYFHAAPTSPSGGRGRLLVDGEERLVANTAVLTDVAPSYGPPGGAALVETSVLGTGHGPETEEAVRRRLATLYATDTSRWELLEAVAVPEALPALPPPLTVRRPVRVAPGLYVCGDHRDTASQQGALVSGRRAAAAVLADLGLAAR